MFIKLLLTFLLCLNISCNKELSPENRYNPTLQEQVDLLKSIIESNSILIEELDHTIGFLKEQLKTDNKALYDFLVEYIESLETQLESSENQVFDALARITALEMNINISSIIDPCGNSPGLDEILLVLEDNSVLAWYKHLGFALLANGSYVTTDRQKCRFTVFNGVVTY